MADESKGDDASSARRWCVAVDGSEVAHRAFLACMRMFSKGDSVVVVHASSADKDYLPDDLKAKAIRTQYESELVTKVATDKSAVEIYERGDKSARESICGFVNGDEAGIDFLCLGCVGRKGPKSDPTLLGSTADQSLRGAHCTSVIVRKKVPAEGAVWIVGVDGSDRAHDAYELTMSLAKAGDSVLVYHIQEDLREEGLPEEYQTENIKIRYEKVVAEASESKEAATVSFEVIDVPRHEKSVADLILEKAHDEAANFVVIGVDGLRNFAQGKKNNWGSVSDRVVRNTRTNVICVQPKGAIYA